VPLAAGLLVCAVLISAGATEFEGGHDCGGKFGSVTQRHPTGERRGRRKLVKA
jgi:hypothetical protein